MVVHEKYQQNLWKKFLKMLLIFLMYEGKSKGKSIPHRPVTDPEYYRKLRLPDFMTIGNMKVLRLSALRTGHLYSPANIPGIHFCYRTSLHQNHITAGRTMSMKNSKYTIGIEFATFRLVAQCKTIHCVIPSHIHPLSKMCMLQKIYQ
jgi:hypothetical protein